MGREYVMLVRTLTDADRAAIRQRRHESPKLPPHVLELLFFSTPAEEAKAFAAIAKHPRLGGAKVILSASRGGVWDSVGAKVVMPIGAPDQPAVTQRITKPKLEFLRKADRAEGYTPEEPSERARVMWVATVLRKRGLVALKDGAFRCTAEGRALLDAAKALERAS
jgi:hypothetical protein